MELSYWIADREAPRRMTAIKNELAVKRWEVFRNADKSIRGLGCDWKG